MSRWKRALAVIASCAWLGCNSSTMDTASDEAGVEGAAGTAGAGTPGTGVAVTGMSGAAGAAIAAPGTAGASGTMTGAAGATSDAGAGGRETTPAPGTPASSGTGGAAGPSAAGSGAAGMSAIACEHGASEASEVIFMGDSFITRTWGEIPQNIERLAREAGALGADESYRMHAVPAAPIASIVSQFDQALRDGPVEVVIMDGAGIDVVILGACGTESACEPIIAQIRDLWQHMGEQGVQWIVYLSYADLVSDPSANQRHDILRAGVLDLCNGLTMPQCVLHDQRPTWDGHPEYYSDGLHASAEGSRVTGGEIWKLMVQNCIAQ